MNIGNCFASRLPCSHSMPPTFVVPAVLPPVTNADGCPADVDGGFSIGEHLAPPSSPRAALHPTTALCKRSAHGCPASLSNQGGWWLTAEPGLTDQLTRVGVSRYESLLRYAASSALTTKWNQAAPPG